MSRSRASALAALLGGLAAGLAAWLLLASSPSGDAGHQLDDGAGLLSPAQAEGLRRHHALLLAEHDIDYHVVTRREGGAVDRDAHALFAERAVGAASRSGRGLLLLLDAASDRVRIEVSAALEGVYPDALIAYLEHRQMVPFFRERRIADGILATTELIVARAQEADAGKAFDPARLAAFSAGGGAATYARIGLPAPPRDDAARPDLVAGATPEATLAAYLRAMRERAASRRLELYSAATRDMLQRWTMTPAQMDSVAGTYGRCTPEAPRLDAAATRAVIRYPPAARRCAPWFLVREDGAWRLDLATMQSAIRFNHRNEWRFAERDRHPFAFAFADWRFDQHGFPRP
jgi:uncharacterized protein